MRSTENCRMRIVPLSAFSDNYIWAIVRGSRCALVDPGETGPALRWLEREALTLDAILITHHHQDHTGGVAELLDRFPDAQVLGPHDERIPLLTRSLADGERVSLAGMPELVCLSVPGHTRSHIAWLCGDALFCGDTLFSAGCGRIFEGTTDEMLASLDRLAALPDSTRIFPAHEYTLANLAFAEAVEPGNEALAARKRICSALIAQSRTTLPVSLGEEKRYNPFLRCDEVRVQAAARERDPATPPGRSGAFATLRAWKNTF